MLQSIQLFLINVLMFASIGLIVGVVIILPQRQEASQLFILLTSALIGVVIGMVTKTSVLLLNRYVKNSSLLSYGLMLLIAGGLTLLVSCSEDFKTKLIMLAIVEPLALLSMYFNKRYIQRLNEGLKRKQTELGQVSAPKNP